MEWWRSLVNGLKQTALLLRRVRILETEVRSLQADVQQLCQISPIRPPKLKVLYGIRWGQFEDDPKWHPFCPVCAADNQWMPLTREIIDGAMPVQFVCMKCNSAQNLTIEQEAEAARPNLVRT